MKGLRSSAKVTVVGSAGQDATMQVMPYGRAVWNVSIGVGGSQIKGTKGDWYKVTVFGDEAEILNQMDVKQGAGLKVIGYPKIKAYKTKDGESKPDINVYPDEIIANMDGTAWVCIYQRKEVPDI